MAGLVYTSWGISMEYFEYKTTSFTAIRDYKTDNITAPAIVLCFRFDIKPQKEAKIGQLFNGPMNFFNDNEDSWNVSRVHAVINEKNLRYVTKKYIIGNKYCLFVKISNNFTMEYVSSLHHLQKTHFYGYQMTVAPLFSDHAWHYNDKKCLKSSVYLQVVSDESTMMNTRTRIESRDLCRYDRYRSYNLDVSYASYITVRLPPPYDTNCLDYGKQGIFLSRFDCFDQCIKKLTKKWGVVPGSTLIDKATYSKSEDYIAPADIIEDKEKLNRLQNENKQLMKLWDTYRTVNSKWDRIKESCQNSCFQRGCISEYISPWISNFEGSGKQKNITLSCIYPRLMTSCLPTQEVSSVPKQQLMDYIVYICSGLSFWLGFCPLTIANYIVWKIQELLRKKTKESMTLEERMRNIERTQEVRFRRLESVTESVHTVHGRPRPTESFAGQRPEPRRHKAHKVR
jgi:hypothetical protein